MGNNAESVLVIDPAQRETISIGHLGRREHKYAGACVADNGSIFCVPYNAQNVLRIDPFIMHLATFGDLGPGGQKWKTGIRVDDGRIFCIPSGATKVLAIDPTQMSYSEIGENLGVDQSKWSGAALGNDGCIYAAPCNAKTVLRIDPASQSCSTFGCLDAGGNKYDTAILGLDQKVYCLPTGKARSVLCVDTHRLRISLSQPVKMETPLPEKSTWKGGVLSSNGRIYCAPSCASAVLVIAPEIYTDMKVAFADKKEPCSVALRDDTFTVPPRTSADAGAEDDDDERYH